MIDRDDIIRMAREVGFGWDDKYHWYVGSRQMEKFAALIAAAEREACAKVCVNLDLYDPRITAYDCAAAIRARGEK